MVTLHSHSKPSLEGRSKWKPLQINFIMLILSWCMELSELFFVVVLGRYMFCLVSGGQILTNFPTIFLPSLGQFHCFCFLLFSREEYKTMKWQWQSMTKTQENNFSEFRERKHLVGKEVQNVMGTLQLLNFLVHVASIYLLQKDTDEANIL